jgi:CTD nuclear envelope phosphatase 1
MNTVNILSHISNTPPPSPPRSRAASQSNLLHLLPQSDLSRESNDVGAGAVNFTEDQGNMGAVRVDGPTYSNADAVASEFDEKTPLLDQSKEGAYSEVPASKTWLIPKRLSAGVIGAVKVVFSAVVAPGRYVIACFYDEDGRFSIMSPVYKISRSFTRRNRKKAAEPLHASDVSDLDEKDRRNRRRISVTQSTTRKSVKRSPSVASSSTALSSDSDMDSERPPTRDDDNDAPSRHTRSRSTASSTADEIAPAKRSIRIKLHNEEALRQRKTKKVTSRSGSSKDGSTQVSPEAAAALKSPTGPPTVSSRQLTKFPRAPRPPRPLIPRRQPSYSTSGPSAVGPHQKTLIIDLDETLIHSMAKSGSYARGHMVEVKLQHSMAAPGQVIGPQVPILYYVHKRPHCDEFLKKVQCASSCETNIPLIRAGL